MFDFAWSEIGLIAAVALILIGPKDLPVAIRAVTDVIKKARRMAGEFQTHVDEMLREANLDDVRNQISQLRNFDIRTHVEQAVDPDGSLRNTLASNPLEPAPTTTLAPVEEVAVAEAPAVTLTAPEPDPQSACVPPEPAVPAAPAFVPPAFVATASKTSAEAEVPAFIPPGAVLQPHSRPPA